MQTTYERLRAILVKEYKLDVGQVSLDAPLEALGIDSLGLADMLFNLEDEFHIVLPPEQVDLPTIGDVVNFIDGLSASQNSNTAPAGVRAAEILHAP